MERHQSAIEEIEAWSDPESLSDKSFLVGSLDYWKWRKGKCEAELRRLFKLQAKIELSIATAKVRGFANLGEAIRDNSSSSSAAAASSLPAGPVSDPPTPEESDSEVTDYDSLPPVPVSGGVGHHDHDTESEKKKKKNN